MTDAEKKAKAAADAAARAAETARVKALWNQINATTLEIARYSEAKHKVANEKLGFDKDMTDWTDRYNLLNGNNDLTSVKKTDLFEGEMAFSLKGFVKGTLSGIGKGISKGKYISGELDTQITDIDSKITELKEKKQGLLDAI